MQNSGEYPETGERAMTLREAADKLRMPYSTLFQYRHQIGFQFKPRGQWRIWPSVLAEFTKPKNNVALLSLRVVGEQACPSAKTRYQEPGTLTSALRLAKELDALLERQTEKPRRNTTTA